MHIFKRIVLALDYLVKFVGELIPYASAAVVIIAFFVILTLETKVTAFALVAVLIPVTVLLTVIYAGMLIGKAYSKLLAWARDQTK